MIAAVSVHKLMTNENEGSESKRDIVNYMRNIQNIFAEEKEMVQQLVNKRKEKVSTVEGLKNDLKSTIDEFVSKTELLLKSEQLIEMIDKEEAEDMKQYTKKGLLFTSRLPDGKGLKKLFIEKMAKNKGYAFVTFAISVVY